jgi:hypothetical protein
MTDEEIHNIYLHMSGKAEGLVEATGEADFPVLFARAILEYKGLTKDAPVEIAFNPEVVGYVAPQTWVGLTDDDWNSTLYDTEFRAGAEWAEAKLKDKNT